MQTASLASPVKVKIGFQRACAPYDGLTITRMFGLWCALATICISRKYVHGKKILLKILLFSHVNPSPCLLVVVINRSTDHGSIRVPVLYKNLDWNIPDPHP